MEGSVCVCVCSFTEISGLHSKTTSNENQVFNGKVYHFVSVLSP